MNKSKKITWTCENKIKQERGADWFWVVGIIGVGAVTLCIYFNNFLLALLIVIGIMTLFIQSRAELKKTTYQINRKGVQEGETLYPYSTLESFWVIDEDGWDRDRIILKSKKLLMPLIIIPLGENADIDEISDYLLDYLNEEEMEESFIDKVAILLGF